MSDVGDLIDEARAEYAVASPDFFPDLCAVQSPTVSQGTSGGSRPTWAAVTGLSSVPCRYEAKSGVERDAGGAVTAFTDHEISMPYKVGSTPVLVGPKYRLVVAARGTRSSQTFEVVAPLPDSGGMAFRCSAVLRN